jgi:Uma2 family endonuclease
VPFFVAQNMGKIRRETRLFDMNVQLPVRMGQDAFLAWVESQEENYELDRGRVIMMTGGTRAHWQIAFNLAKALEARVDQDRFAVLPEFGVRPDAASVRFPDIVIDLAGQSPQDQTATAPVLIAEVLSPSSERVDLGDKAAEFLRLPSLCAYLVFAQDEMKAWVWTRGVEGFAPGAIVLEGEGNEATVRIDALGIELPFSDVYARVRLNK